MQTNELIMTGGRISTSSLFSVLGLGGTCGSVNCAGCGSATALSAGVFGPGGRGLEIWGSGVFPVQSKTSEFGIVVVSIVHSMLLNKWRSMSFNAISSALGIN